MIAQVGRGEWRPPEPPPVVELPTDPGFHEFASEWFDRHEDEWRENTRLDYRWQLTHHLLPFFAHHKLSEITAQEVDRYRQAKVRAGRLSAESINKTISRIAQILDEAVEYGLLERNPARGKKRRMKAAKPRRTWLDRADQLEALLEAAAELDAEARADRGTYRHPMVATLALAGLRIGELLALRWRDVDLTAGRLRVTDAKTDAGVREVDLLPALKDILFDYWTSRPAAADALVFPTSTGRRQGATNVRRRVLAKAVERANDRREGAGLVPLPESLTPHSLRRTFASILVAIGENPISVMEQLGHTDPKLTLRIYAQAMRREKGERDRLRALVGGAEWAPLGTSATHEGSMAAETLRVP